MYILCDYFCIMMYNNRFSQHSGIVFCACNYLLVSGLLEARWNAMLRSTDRDLKLSMEAKAKKNGKIVWRRVWISFSVEIRPGRLPAYVMKPQKATVR